MSAAQHYCSVYKQKVVLIGMRLPKAMLSGTSGGCTSEEQRLVCCLINKRV